MLPRILNYLRSCKRISPKPARRDKLRLSPRAGTPVSNALSEECSVRVGPVCGPGCDIWVTQFLALRTIGVISLLLGSVAQDMSSSLNAVWRFLIVARSIRLSQIVTSGMRRHEWSSYSASNLIRRARRFWELRTQCKFISETGYWYV